MAVAPALSATSGSTSIAVASSSAIVPRATSAVATSSQQNSISNVDPNLYKFVAVSRNGSQFLVPRNCTSSATATAGSNNSVVSSTTDVSTSDSQSDIDPRASAGVLSFGISIPLRNGRYDITQWLESRVHVLALEEKSKGVELSANSIANQLLGEVEAYFPRAIWSYDVTTICRRVVDIRRKEYGDVNVITNKLFSPQYRYTLDDDPLDFVHGVQVLPIYQQSTVKTREKHHRVIGFGDPGLFWLAREPGINLYVDATFKVCPKKPQFYQLLIFMVYSHALDKYQAIFYVLMSSKAEHLYGIAFDMFINAIAGTGNPCRPCHVSCDFEAAIFNTIARKFTHADIRGCLFHYKKAIREKMEELKFTRSEIKIMMTEGVIDMLRVIPVSEIHSKGIHFVRRLFFDESNGDVEYRKRVHAFFEYFISFWMKIHVLWNIFDYINKGEWPLFLLKNATNNPLESFNNIITVAVGVHPRFDFFLERLKQLVKQHKLEVNQIASLKRKSPTHNERGYVSGIHVDYEKFDRNDESTWPKSLTADDDCLNSFRLSLISPYMMFKIHEADDILREGKEEDAHKKIAEYLHVQNDDYFTNAITTQTFVPPEKRNRGGRGRPKKKQATTSKSTSSKKKSSSQNQRKSTKSTKTSKNNKNTKNNKKTTSKSSNNNSSDIIQRKSSDTIRPKSTSKSTKSNVKKNVRFDDDSSYTSSSSSSSAGSALRKAFYEGVMEAEEELKNVPKNVECNEEDVDEEDEEVADGVSYEDILDFHSENNTTPNEELMNHINNKKNNKNDERSPLRPIDLNSRLGNMNIQSVKKKKPSLPTKKNRKSPSDNLFNYCEEAYVRNSNEKVRKSGRIRKSANKEA